MKSVRLPTDGHSGERFGQEGIYAEKRKESDKEVK